MWTEVLGWTFNAKDMVHYVYLKSIWNHLEATSMNYLQVVFAFFFQGEVLHETASDQLSQLGAALISAWGVVALTKETLAPEEDPKTEPLLKRWDEKIIREDMRSTSIWLIEIPKCMPKCWRSEVIRRGDKKWETKVGLNVLYRLVFCLSIRQATGRDNSSARHLVVEHTKIMSAGCDLQDIFIPCDLGWKLKKTGKETAVERVLKLNLPKQVWGPFIVWPVLWTFFWLCTQFAISELESQSWKSTSFAAAVDWFFGLLIWIMGYIDILLSFGLWEILVTPATGWKPKWHPLHTSPPFWIWYHPTNPTIPIPAPNPSICGPTKSPAQLGRVFSFWQASTLALTSNMQHPVAPTVCGRAVATCWSVWTVQFWEIRSESWNCLERGALPNDQVVPSHCCCFPKAQTFGTHQISRD